MKNHTILIAILVILSLIFLGCVEQTPVGTPTPTAQPTPERTVVDNISSEIAALTPTPTPTPRTEPPVNYTVLLDSDYGFYRIRAAQGDTIVNLPPSFDPSNFSINVGDSVKWINQDTQRYELTIISNDGLWTSQAGLLFDNYDYFEYTFKSPGRYTFSIKDSRRSKNQTIVVNP